MKKLFALTIVCVLLSIIPAMAADIMLNQKITDAQVAIDKNGKEYVRLIIEENRTLQGVKYSAGVPVMVFGDSLVAQAKQLKIGDTLKCVADGRQFEGRLSYTVRAFAK